MAKFTKETKLVEVLNKRWATEVLLKNNVPCVTCPLADFEMEEISLGEICKLYGIETEKLLKELNEKDKE